ncbi:formate/nitrite transporter family protein [Robertkochia aurantiaca]|uniref:formate/nitrite transporter family protein n=1 Tax=Robertkochia aurantiaca TaxID=2873700 RepID=UPI001CCF69B0|nr:formate/nitrite transporter family protein [Robertkochia sp. 3YJGBD-33]
MSEESKPKEKEEPDHDDIFLGQLYEGLETFRKNNVSSFLSALMAGLEIGFTFFMVVIGFTIFHKYFPEEIVPYLTAFLYPFGFILVILAKSLLFTEQTSILSLPVLSGKRPLSELAKLWGIVISGNIVGGCFIGWALSNLGISLGVISHEGIKGLVLHVSHYSYWVILGSAVLAGWLMGLLSWITTSTSNIFGKIMVIYIITFIISIAGLHHSIVGNIEMFVGFLKVPGISFLNYLVFLAVALTGNAVGGVVFVGILKYGTFVANKRDVSAPRF